MPEAHCLSLPCPPLSALSFLGCPGPSVCYTQRPSLGSLFRSCQYFNPTPLLHWARGVGSLLSPGEPDLTPRVARNLCLFRMDVSGQLLPQFPTSQSYPEVEGCGHILDPKRILYG